MKLFRAFIVGFCILALTHCGGSGSSSSVQSIRVLSPENDSTFSSGEMINFTIEPVGFSFGPPVNMRDLTLRHHPGEDTGASTHSSEDTHSTDTHSTDTHNSDDTPHSSDETTEVHMTEMEETHMSESHGSTEESHSTDSHGTDSHGHDSHSHDSGATNPDARTFVHYHVYLNDAAGSDPHLTSWSTVDGYQLPDDLAPGTHSLRFELRDETHTPLGVPDTVLFFTIIE